MENKPKLALAPPPPSLSLDGPLSLRWRDGSALHVLEDGSIVLVEPQAPYSVKRCSTALSLVSPTSSSATP